METPAGRDLQDAVLEDRTRKFQEFLEDRTHATDYRDLIRLMLVRDERRLVVDLDEVRDFDREFWQGLLDTPGEFLPAADRALQLTVVAIAEARHNVGESDVFYVAYRGSFGDHAVNPRTISASHVGKLLSLEGIVTRCSLVRPKVVRSVHYCAKTDRFHAREYYDQAMASTSTFVGSVYPTEDADGNPLTTEYGYCTYRDHQTMSIQEMPERAPAGQLPRSIDVILDDDLVDTVKPGDRIQLVGMYKSMGSRSSSKDGGGSAQFKTVILANNIVLLSSKANGGVARARISDIDVRNINRVAKKRNVFELLSQSLAPSIYGHDYIKKAILLMLLSGMEKNLENGTHIRGDINILMVGDPSTAKSQLLRFVLNTAPLAIATTGRGSSGVGLTAAVTSDKETGERRLEAGAMVLADRGVVCIDEFDKMSDVDRVAIHEVMEQQTVTIAKAGIHTSLNARCSVIAAANPVFGQYDTHKDPHRNIALPDSLLSRFDLLFVVTDEVEDARDRAISEHVLRMHRYVKAGTEEGIPVREDSGPSMQANGGAKEDADEHKVYEKFDALLHAGVTTRTKFNGQHKIEVLSIPFIKKYLHYAKMRVRPVLSQNAADYIVNTYAGLRNDELSAQQRKTSPITARTLETLIRLATAHAKARLSQRVERKDAKVAEQILRFALFKEVVRAERKKRQRVNEDSSDEEEDEDDEDDEDDSATFRSSAVPSSQSTRQLRGSSSNGRAYDESMTSVVDDEDAAPQDNFQLLAQAVEAMGVSDGAAGSSSMAGQQPGTGVSNSRAQLFTRIMGQLLNTPLFADEYASVDVLVAEVNKRMEQEDLFSEQEATAALRKMNDRNQIMLSGNMVYKI
ncbi:MCM2/3/5 family-domain-containing protein [Myxozyma melibiosi]|uniref:DNA replication licensing factor MCM3 n=1 Tax=Myxozyma melibiosi TaxID=54550 RepID=A0ABR1F7F5_9ASCO